MEQTSILLKGSMISVFLKTLAIFIQCCHCIFQNEEGKGFIFRAATVLGCEG